MLINGVDISSYGAKLLGIKLNSTNITNNYYIPTNVNTPILISSTNGGKPISVRIAINGNSVDGNYQVYSKLKKDMNKCVLKPKNSIFYFDCILTGDYVNTQFRKVIKEVEFNFICYQYTEQQTIAVSSFNTFYEINNTGTQDTPAIVTFTPKNSYATDSTGMLFHIYSRYVSASDYRRVTYNTDFDTSDVGKTFVLNGENSTFLMDGENAIKKLYIEEDGIAENAYEVYGIGKFPTLKPGINKIQLYSGSPSSLISQAEFEFKIQWKPRWL